MTYTLYNLVAVLSVVHHQPPAVGVIAEALAGIGVASAAVIVNAHEVVIVGDVHGSEAAKIIGQLSGIVGPGARTESINLEAIPEETNGYNGDIQSRPLLLSLGSS